MMRSVLSVVIALVLQGCVWPDDETLPAFIEAGELRNSLESSFTRRREILDLANEELIGIPLDHSHDVFLSVTDVDSVFTGVYPDVSVGVFPDAWKEVAIMTGLNSPGTDECLMLIWMFYIERPVWYTASHGDLELLRNCMGHALMLIQATPVEATPQGQVIARTLAGLMPVAFSAQAELRMRTKPSTAQYLAPNVYFGKFMADHPRLMHMLYQHADTSPDMDDVDSKELRFAEWMGSGFRFQHHAAEFVDYHWSRLALNGESNKSIRLWKRLTEGSDEKIVEHESAKQSLMFDPFVHLRSKLNPADSWELTVGPFLRALVEENGTDDICISSVTLDTVVTTPHMVPDLYKCIVEKLETGALRFPDEYPAENLATVMHMIRVSTSATAYVVNS